METYEHINQLVYKLGYTVKHDLGVCGVRDGKKMIVHGGYPYVLQYLRHCLKTREQEEAKIMNINLVMFKEYEDNQIGFNKALKDGAVYPVNIDYAVPYQHIFPAPFYS